MPENEIILENNKTELDALKDIKATSAHLNRFDCQR